MKMRFSKKINNQGFTLFELMVSMTIFGLLMISVLDSVANIGIARTKSMTRIILLEELYFFSEKLASSIKDGGIIDYEEYWNRQVV
jgi:prepilin-type N-terminal cleavage/methylation domain-containing protein